MGCSASCPSANFVSQQKTLNSNSFSSSSSHSNSQFQSPFHSFSDPSSTPISRALSLPTPLIHHPPTKKGDSNHFVSLTSTTYGSLTLTHPQNSTNSSKKVQDFEDSDDPLSPDSVINTWELMEGLDEEEFSFQIVDLPEKTRSEIEIDEIEADKSYEFVEAPKSKPLWKHLSEESMLAKMESNVVSSYNNALLGRQTVCEKAKETLKPEKIESLSLKDCNPLVDSDQSCKLPGPDDKIVLYYTSLRGIRKTYEDCCSVRVIFRGFRVCVDERDISMDRSFRKELQDQLKGKPLVLPQVFINGKHIGGSEEIKQLNESGELANLLEGFSVMEGAFGCESCGDARFVPCANCSGSRKVYEEDEGELRRCTECNENGLIRCSVCCP